MAHAKRQNDKAKEVHNLHQMMMFLSVSDFKNAMKVNHIHNRPVTVDDVNAAEDIFGKDIFALKEKTTTTSLFAVTINAMEMPLELEIVESHNNNVFLGIDTFRINGLAFSLWCHQKLKLVATEEIDKKCENNCEFASGAWPKSTMK